MKTKKRKVTRRQKAPEPPQEVQDVQPVVEKPKPKPEELLLQWIKLHTREEVLKEQLYDDNKTFMEETSISEIVGQIAFPERIVQGIMSAAYNGPFKNPFVVLDAIQYDGGWIFERLTNYFDQYRPSEWNLAFCELIAACERWCTCLEKCRWREDRNKARAYFVEFVNSEVSSTLHSSRLYRFFFELFFGYNSATSFVMVRAEDNIEEEGDQAKLMQGLIEEGKNGFFPWMFEGYLQ